MCSEGKSERTKECMADELFSIVWDLQYKNSYICQLFNRTKADVRKIEGRIRQSA